MREDFDPVFRHHSSSVAMARAFWYHDIYLNELAVMTLLVFKVLFTFFLHSPFLCWSSFFKHPGPLSLTLGVLLNWSIVNLLCLD